MVWWCRCVCSAHGWREGGHSKPRLHRALQAARKEAEAEKARLTRALEEAKKRAAKATKDKHAAEVAAAEVGERAALGSDA